MAPQDSAGSLTCSVSSSSSSDDEEDEEDVVESSSLSEDVKTKVCTRSHVVGPNA